MISEGLW